MRADVNDRDAAAPLFSEHSSVSGGHRLEDRLFYGEVRVMNGIHQRLMLVNRSRDDMHVCFEPRAHDTSRIAVSCPAIKREVLRRNLQHDPVFHAVELLMQARLRNSDRRDRFRADVRIHIIHGY